MNPDIAAQLKDIQGLDAVSWWPPAGGWWLLALALIGLALGLFYLLRHLYRYPPGSWRRDAWRQLRQLRQRSSFLPADQLAGELSVLMRRIAVARYGRDQAAALVGEHWLDWLQRNDPAGFDWTVQGKVLLKISGLQSPGSTLVVLERFDLPGIGPVNAQGRVFGIGLPAQQDSLVGKEFLVEVEPFAPVEGVDQFLRNVLFVPAGVKFLEIHLVGQKIL